MQTRDQKSATCRCTVTNAFAQSVTHPIGVTRLKVAWEGILSRSGPKTRGHLQYHNYFYFPQCFVEEKESVLEAFLLIKYF